MPGVLISTAAAIIASQALITGSFTLISEAVSLNFWPKIRILFPTHIKGQVYLPFVNWFLWIICSLVVIFFQGILKYGGSLWTGNYNYNDNDHICYCHTTCIRKVLILVFRYSVLILFLTIEGSFLIANLHKFRYGGWFTLLLALIYFLIMLGLVFREED